MIGREKPVLPPFSKWAIQNNRLGYLLDKEDTAGQPDAQQRLVRLINAFSSESAGELTEQLFKFTRREMLLKQVRFSARQEARLWYWGMLISIARSDWHEALQRLDFIAFDKQHEPLLVLELDRWRATAALNSHQFRIALDACNRIIAFVDAHPPIVFSQGDCDNFTVNWLYLRSVARFGMLWLDDSRQDLLLALEMIQDWIAENTRKRVYGSSAALTAAYHVNPPVGDFVLAIHKILTKEVLASDEPEVVAWITLYQKVCWQLAIVQMWMGRQSDTVDALFHHEQAADVMDSVMKMCRKIASLRPSLARAAVMRAEILLSSTDFLPRPLDPTVWQTQVALADAMLDRAANEAGKHLHAQRQSDLPALIAYTRLMARYQRAHLAQQFDGLDDMIDEAEQLCLAAIQHQHHHLQGRCQFFLGNLYKEQGDFYLAKANFALAERIFAAEGNQVRAQEARDKISKFLI